MMREQIESLIRKRGGIVTCGEVTIEYRHEQPWGIPCTLDVFRESLWQDARGKKEKVRVLPEHYQEIAEKLPRIVDDICRVKSGLILAIGAQGISLLWRETPATSGLLAAAERFDHFRGRVQALLPDGLDVSLADEELHRFYDERYSPRRAAQELTGWLQALSGAAAKGE
jgi:hypothetical protein